MKKTIAMLLGLMLVAAAPLAALAESPSETYLNAIEAEPLPPYEGLVTELFEGGFLMDDINMGVIQINTDENTVWDGILSIQPIEVGMYVLVDHNGVMTRSIPPQVYGVRVGCHTLNGIAGEMTEEGVLLTGDPIFGDVFVQMSPTMATVFPGVPMTVYYDGVMTMSLPGKVNARYVLVPELTGVVSGKDGAGFTLTDEEGNSYRILTSDSLAVGLLTEPVEELLAEETATLDEAIATEEAVVAEEAAAEETAAEEAVAEDATTEEAAEEAAAEDTADALPTIEWNDGDTVTVFHQGPIAVEPAAEGEEPVELVALGLLVHK